MAKLFYELWEGYALYIVIGIILVWLIFSISFFGFFRKTNQKTWKAFIPIYQLFPFMIILDIPIFFVALLFVPLVNILTFLFISYRLGVVFEQKGIMKYGLILFPLIFYPILALFKFPYKPSEQLENETIDPSILYNAAKSAPVTELTQTTPVLGEKIDTQPAIENNHPTISVASNGPVDIIDIDNEDETWQDTQKQEEEVKKVVNIDPLANDPLYNPTAKPIEKADLEHYKVCPQCGAKLDVKATTCFLCGTKVG